MKNTLHRGRINQIYHESADCSIISVTAGPGYGKTQSVMSFAAELDAHIIWTPFSQLDNYTAHFWENFCNALRIVDEGFSGHCLKNGFPNDAGTMYRFLEQFLENIGTEKPFLFVFDDCHLIKEHSIVIFIHNLLETLSDYVSAFLISRSPCLLTAEKHLQGHSVRLIDEGVLAFSSEETAEYFKFMHISLPQNLLTSIYKKTEGWPIAVCLFALYGQENPGAIAASPQLTDDILLTMIDREIFSQCTPEVQKLLLKLSLLSYLPARYVEEVYGREVLIQISSNLLIRYNAHSHSYSMHQLLRDFLKQRAHTLGENEIRSTYRVAADWFMKYNLKVDALHCYEYLRDDQNLWNIIWDTLTASKYPSRELLDYFQKILDYLAGSETFHNDWLPLAQAIYYTLSADYDLAEKEFQQIILDNSVGTIRLDTGEIIGEAQLNVALIRMLHGDTSFCRYFLQARDHLPRGSSTLTSGRMIVLNGDTITLKNGDTGELDAWIQAHRESAADADILMHNSMHGMADLITSQAHYYRGDMCLAEQFALTALDCARERLCIDIAGSAYYILEKISMYRGNYRRTQKYIKDSYAYMQEYNENPFYNLPEIAEGYFLTQIEYGGSMKDWILNESLYYKSLLSSNYGQERVLKGQYLLKEQRYSELFAHLDHSRKVYEQSHRYPALIYTHLLYCFAHNQTGNLEEALRSFETAYKMTAANDIIMPFVEMGHYTRTICRRIRSRSSIIPDAWLDMIQTKATTYRKRMQILQTEYQKEYSNHSATPQLTSRERHRLILISQGLIQSELAVEMSISVNTVKSMQKSIYIKLGAFNSTHAVYIAMKNDIIR